MATKSKNKLLNYLESVHEKYENISKLLSEPETLNDNIKFRELSKELAKIKPLEENFLKLNKYHQELAEAQELITESQEEELKALAETEKEQLQEDISSLQEEIKLLMVSDIEEDNRNCFLEIRAGAGGNEASLFAQDLLRMYSRIAERNSWKAEISSTNESQIGGIKEIVIYIKGKGVYKNFRHESGVHRVQRVPVTESSGRIHTSTVTVAVLPEVEDVDLEINPKDIRIDTYRASGAGGQHVNKTESAIRITHLATNLVVTCQDEKSQHKNKDKALKMLKSRLYELEKIKQDENIAGARKSQVGSGDRSEKIRTYNFPQSRVTDHRITGKNFNIEQVLDGNIEEMVKILLELEAKEKLEKKFKEIIS